MVFQRGVSRITGLIVVGLVAACGSNEPGSRNVTNQDIAERGLSDDTRGTDGSSVRDVFDNNSANDELGGGNLRVNKFLWRGSLDTLSFLPLASTDPFSGVITTDWGTTVDDSGERFKVTVFIGDEKLTASSLKVAVFREVRRSGDWVSAPVQDQTPRKIEDAILTRARQLRIEAKEAG